MEEIVFKNFIDIQKAFYSINSETTWQILSCTGIPYWKYKKCFANFLDNGGARREDKAKDKEKDKEKERERERGVLHRCRLSAMLNRENKKTRKYLKS